MKSYQYHKLALFDLYRPQTLIYLCYEVRTILAYNLCNTYFIFQRNVSPHFVFHFLIFYREIIVMTMLIVLLAPDPLSLPVFSKHFNILHLLRKMFSPDSMHSDFCDRFKPQTILNFVTLYERYLKRLIVLYIYCIFKL